MNKTLTPRLVNTAKLTILLILLILPFHEFLTTWLASNFGHLNLFRIWKEIVLVLISPIFIYLAFAKNKLKHWLLKDKLVLLIVIFAIIVIILGIIGYAQKRVNLSALIAGLIIDLRFFLIFLFTLVLSQYTDFFKKYWRQILIYPAIAVILFGFTQLYLPSEFLSHFGYGKGTIPALESVNGIITIQRVQSFLRGANPLGAYLVLITPIFIFFSKRDKLVRIISTMLSLVVLFFTYSRSAYIGLFLTLAMIFYFLVFERIKYVHEHKKLFYYIMSAAALLMVASVIIFRNNPTFDNIFLHTSKNSASKISSNTAHESALKTNTTNFIDHPLGQGVGIAGPASAHNNHPAMIAENFYIQIGQETGAIGLAVFLAINIIVGYRLYLRREDPLALLLYASLIGISFINMVSHAWADDTLSLIWWAFAGVALSPKLLKSQAKNETAS